jgi:hypothetical protein
MPTKQTPEKPRSHSLATGRPIKTGAETVTINIPLPRDLHRRLRIKALKEDLSVVDAVATAIDEWADAL